MKAVFGLFDVDKYPVRDFAGSVFEEEFVVVFVPLDDLVVGRIGVFDDATRDGVEIDARVGNIVSVDVYDLEFARIGFVEYEILAIGGRVD